MPKEKEVKLSATRINSFLRCKLKYWLGYIEHYPKLINPAFLFGRVAHETLEDAGRIWMEKGEFSEEDKVELMRLFDVYAAKEGLDDYEIHVEGKKLVKERIDNFELGRGILSLEENFGTPDGRDIRTKDNVPLIGAMDKVVEVDDDTIMVVDYKTSRIVPTVDQLRYDIQLSIYDLVAHIIWPQYDNIILSLDMLKSDPVYSYRTPEERIEFENYLKAVYDEMINIKKKDAKARLNIFCPWCDFKEYCDTYKRACKKSDYKFLATAGLEDSEIIDEWKHLRSVSKILSEREKELSMIMMEKIKTSGTNIKSDEIEIYIRQNSRKSYDLGKIIDKVPPEHFVDLVNTINMHALEAYMEKNPKARAELKDVISLNFTKPFLAEKKLKKTLEDLGDDDGE